MNTQTRKSIACLLILFVMVLSAHTFMGCASSSKTVKKEVINDSTGQTTVVTEKEVVVDHNSDGGSVLGSIFNVVGEVLAFPFRILAGVFQAIF